TVVEAETGSLYRSAPIVDLAPLRYKVPWSGITVARDDAALDIRLNPPWLGRWSEWALRGVALAALADGIWASGIARGPGVFLKMLIGFFVFLFMSVRSPSDHDALTLIQTGWGPPLLRWTVQRQRKIRSEAAAELGTLIAAHDAGDHVRIELSDGRSWKVG